MRSLICPPVASPGPRGAFPEPAHAVALALDLRLARTTPSRIHPSRDARLMTLETGERSLTPEILPLPVAALHRPHGRRHLDPGVHAGARTEQPRTGVPVGQQVPGSGEVDAH